MLFPRCCGAGCRGPARRPGSGRWCLRGWRVLPLSQTWVYIVFLHFGGGALAGTHLGAVIVGGLLVALLLVPLFQFVVRTGWEYGPVRMLEPLRWGGAFHDFLDEIRRARASRGSGTPGEPGPTENPDAGSQLLTWIIRLSTLAGGDTGSCSSALGTGRSPGPELNGWSPGGSACHLVGCAAPAATRRREAVPALVVRRRAPLADVVPHASWDVPAVPTAAVRLNSRFIPPRGDEVPPVLVFRVHHGGSPVTGSRPAPSAGAEVMADCSDSGSCCRWWRSPWRLARYTFGLAPGLGHPVRRARQPDDHVHLRPEARANLAVSSRIPTNGEPPVRYGGNRRLGWPQGDADRQYDAE